MRGGSEEGTTADRVEPASGPPGRIDARELLDVPPPRGGMATVRRGGRAFRVLGCRVTASARPLPEFLIVGAQRAGTTSLFRALLRHPGVIAPVRRKEAHFFDHRYRSGLSAYRAEFPTSMARRRREEVIGFAPITGEATPYYLFHPLAPSRVATSLPDVKIVVMLRDPVTRAYSHYRHSVAWDFEPLSFEDALEAEPHRLAGEEERIRHRPGYRSFAHQHQSYVARGNYLPQVRRWQEVVPPERMLVLVSEELFAEPHVNWCRVTSFLGLPEEPLAGLERANVAAGPPMLPETRAALREHFSPLNEELAQTLGRSLPW